MKSFKIFLQESRKIVWNGNPKIGWWQDQDPITLYHGTNISLLNTILKDGLDRKDPDTGMISLALEPNTAAGYASMFGGESTFRRSGKRSKSVKEEDRVVFVFSIPMQWIRQHMDVKLGGNVGEAKDHMTNKSLYDEWSAKNKQDQEYYMLCELRVNTTVPSAYIKGYMQRSG